MDVNTGITHVTDDTFASQVEQAKGLVLVDFWAQWCGPCHRIAPVLEALAKSYEGKIQVTKLDVDANQNTTIRFNIRSIPALLFFKDGQLVDTVIGVVPKDTLQARIDKHLA